MRLALFMAGAVFFGQELVYAQNQNSYRRVAPKNPSSSTPKLYKHVDEKGNVSFTDRPQNAEQKPQKLQAPNVSSPELTRQLNNDLRNKQREEFAEHQAQQRRYMSQRQKELEAERERRAKEADPYSPVQDPARPRVRR